MNFKYLQNFWLLRQNPSGKTNQEQMYDFILSQKLVTCPYSHFNEERNNVIDGLYNENNAKNKSYSQDRKFIEKIKIGDIILIPFSGLKKCITARIISEPIYSVETGLFTKENNGTYQILKQGDKAFRPIARKIEIIDKTYNLNYELKKLPRMSLSILNSEIKNALINS